MTKSKPKETPHLVERTVAKKLDEAQRTVKRAQRSIERSKKLLKVVREAQSRKHPSR